MDTSLSGAGHVELGLRPNDEPLDHAIMDVDHNAADPSDETPGSDVVPSSSSPTHQGHDYDDAQSEGTMAAPTPSIVVSRSVTPSREATSIKKPAKKSTKASTSKATKSSKGSNSKKAKVERATSSAPSFVEGEEHQMSAVLADEEDAEEQVKVYCICHSLFDDERPMIACDLCDEWYHAVCMGVIEEQIDLVDMFICTRCQERTGRISTWKTKCIRPECTRAAVLPLSRYCSERCGILLAASRMAQAQKARTTAKTNGSMHARGNGKVTMAVDRAFAQKVLDVEGITLAQKREAHVEWHRSGRDDRLAWFATIRGEQNGSTIIDLVEPTLQAMGLASDLTNDNGNLLDLVLPHAEQLADLNEQMQSIMLRRAEVNEQLDLLGHRTTLLHLAEDRATTLEPIRGEEADQAKTAKRSSTKAKKGKGATSTHPEGATEPARGQPRCGYDERLHWDDERLASWATSAQGKAMLNESEPLDGIVDDGTTSGPGQSTNPVDGDTMEMDQDEQSSPATIQPRICGTSKRKCKRHPEWTLIRMADLDVERQQRTQQLATLAQEAQDIQHRSEQIRMTIRRVLQEDQLQRKRRDEQLARSLAQESSRRAPLST